MVIFHSYVSLPEGIPFSATQVRQVAVSSSRWSSGIGSSLEGPVAYKNSNAICDSEPICCWGISNIDIHHSCMCIYIYICIHICSYPTKRNWGTYSTNIPYLVISLANRRFGSPERPQQVARAKWSLSLCSCHWRTWQVVRYGEMGNLLEKRTLTAKKDRRVGHQHFTRILLDLFGVCYPCIYIYICMYIYIYIYITKHSEIRSEPNQLPVACLKGTHRPWTLALLKYHMLLDHNRSVVSEGCFKIPESLKNPNWSQQSKAQQDPD